MEALDNEYYQCIEKFTSLDTTLFYIRIVDYIIFNVQKIDIDYRRFCDFEKFLSKSPIFWDSKKPNSSTKLYNLSTIRFKIISGHKFYDFTPEYMFWITTLSYLLCVSQMMEVKVTEIKREFLIDYLIPFKNILNSQNLISLFTVLKKIKETYELAFPALFSDYIDFMLGSDIL